MKLSEYAERYNIAAEVIREHNESIRGGAEVAENLEQRAASIRKGIATALRETGQNADNVVTVEELPDDRAGDCHMGNKRTRVDLETSGEHADHVILHELTHREHASNNGGVRVMNGDLEEGITDGAAQAVTGEDIAYSAEKRLAAEVARANEVAIEDLHNAYKEGDSDQINAWYLYYQMKTAA